MTEIRIREKKYHWLPLLLGFLAFVLVAWFALRSYDNDDDLVANEQVITSAMAKDKPVTIPTEEKKDTARPAAIRLDAEKVNPLPPEDLENFNMDWDGSSSDFKANSKYFAELVQKVEAEMNKDHDYSHIALRSLATSLIILSNEYQLENVESIRSKIEIIRKNATALSNKQKSNKHADKIREAAISAAALMKEIQERQFPELDNEVAEVERAAFQINPETLTLKQRENVKAFFNTAAIAMQKMRET